MLKGSLKASYTRKSFIRKEITSPTLLELKSFKLIQERFYNPTFLHHFNPKRPLFLNVDMSKKYRISTIIYHIEGDLDVASVTKDRKAIEFPR